MRAYAPALIAALALTAAGAASAQDTTMPGMSMGHPKPTARNGKGTGVIKAIDATAGTLTIQHGPIPEVSWPAMTMTFQAVPPSLLKGLKVGQKIGFAAHQGSSLPQVTSVWKP